MPAKYLKEHRPDIVERWNGFRNGAFTPEIANITGKEVVWWICPEGHEEEYGISRMVVNDGNLCSVCKDLHSGNLSARRLKKLQETLALKEPYRPGIVSKETWEYIYCPNASESIAVMNPYVAERWHPTLNGPRTPENHSALAHTWVWLVCDNGHEKLFELNGNKQTLDDCVGCQKSVMALSPELVKESWDFEKNTVSPWNLSNANKDVPVWWKCSEGHSHQSTVTRRRLVKNFCQKCFTNREDNLIVSDPHIAAQWHPVKNGESKPEDFTRGSEVKVWWMCQDCQHEWQANIKNRTINGTRCAQCFKSKPGGLSSKHPDVYANLDIEETHKKGVNHRQLGHTSISVVAWKCSVNPEHIWEMSVAKLLQSKVLCPECNTRIKM